MKLLTILSPLLIFGISLSSTVPAKHSLSNIDIFGKSELSAIYILNSEMETEYLLLDRDFVHDEYFFQNISREEFENKIFYRVPVKDSLP
jgi:hypothetical protein